MLRTRIIRLSHLTAEERQKWVDLTARALEPNLFLDPAYLHSAHAWMPKAHDISLLVVEDSRDMLALVPMSRQPRARRLPLEHATTAGPFLRSYASLLTPLVDRHRAEEVLYSLLRNLSRRGSSLPGLIELTLFSGSGDVHEALHDAARRLGVPIIERYRFERPVAHLRPGVDWRAELGPSRRKNLQRYTRRIIREVGDLELRECGDDPAAFRELVALEAAGWKGEPGRGYALALSPAKLAWYEQMTQEFRSRGHLSVTRLRAGGRTIYMSLSFKVGDRFFSTIDAYDEGVSHLRPGNVGRALELDDFQGRGQQVTFDPCIHPRYEESSRQYPDRDLMVGLLLAPRGVHSKMALRALPSVRALRSVVSRKGEKVRTDDGEDRGVGGDLGASHRSDPEREVDRAVG